VTKANHLDTFLWFKAGQLDQAIAFYQSIFSDFQIHHLNPMGPGGPLFTAGFSIHGHSLIGMAVEGGPDFNPSISLSLSVDGQDEVDRLWDALTAEGGKPGRCGWLEDRFGVSWQVVPIQMHSHLGNSDSAKREYAQQALMRMTKIVIKDFEK
jgi:predicted 3-demethylubiquinone-9 3-methyltransferase (glyoxalase superfamily)